MELTYHKVEDYLLPDLEGPEQPKVGTLLLFFHPLCYTDYVS